MRENKKEKIVKNRFGIAVVISVIVIIYVIVVINILSKSSASDQGKDRYTDFSTSVASESDNSSTQKTGENESVEIVEDTGTVEIIKKQDAPYEEWLAAAMVLGISMQYEDFTIDKIYLTGETDIASKGNSHGAYVVFSLNGKKVVLESCPLDAERTETGTMDLYTKDLGFATFDTVPSDSLDTESYQEITMDDLQESISQSLLVSLYEH